MTRRLLSLAAAAMCATATAGCFIGTKGDLQQGAFAYDCSAQRADAACDEVFGDMTTIPDGIAVGAIFSLEYGDEGDFGTVVDPSVFITPAAPSILEAAGGGFRFARPGVSAVLGMRGAEVADFIHLHGEAIDHLQLDNGLGGFVGSVDLAAGASEAVVASPIDAAGFTLAGDLAYAWTSSDESVVTVDPLGIDGANHATLQALQPGTATVTVSVDGASVDIPVTVGGAP